MSLVSLLRRSLQTRPRAYRYAAVGLSICRYIGRVPHEPDYRVFRRLPPRMVFMDIGANRGQSALDFASQCRRSTVVSFEPNPAMARDLRIVKLLLRRRFDFHLFGLSDETSELVLYVPMRGQREVSGEATFERDQLERAAHRIGGPFTVEERIVPLHTVDDIMLSPDVVKVDVQGLELAVLRGMRQTLERSRPMLLIEASRDRDAAIHAELAGLGYTVLQNVDGQLVSPRGDRPLNWFFLHADDDIRFRGVRSPA